MNLPDFCTPRAVLLLLTVVTLTALLLTERAPGPNPVRRAGRPHEAIALLGLAAGVVTWAALGTGVNV